MPKPRWKLQMRTILAIFSMVLTFVYVLLIGMQFYRASINYLSKTFSSQGNNTLTYAAQALEKKLTSVYNVIGSLPQDQSIVSMLTQFDDGTTAPYFRPLMVGITGGVVCALVVGMGSYMIIHATRELREMEAN